jgi:hypothetical protein
VPKKIRVGGKVVWQVLAVGEFDNATPPGWPRGHRRRSDFLGLGGIGLEGEVAGSARALLDLEARRVDGQVGEEARGAGRQFPAQDREDGLRVDAPVTRIEAHVEVHHQILALDSVCGRCIRQSPLTLRLSRQCIGNTGKWCFKILLAQLPMAQLTSHGRTSLIEYAGFLRL